MTAAALLNFLGMAEENGASPWYQPGESAGKRRSGPGTSQAASVEQSALHARRDSEQLLNQIRTPEALTSTLASPADQMVDRVLTANRDKLIAALPEVVDKAARETLTDYTPETAARIAETMIGMLTGTVCRVYPGLCTVTDGKDRVNADEDGHHFDHAGHAITVPSSTRPEDPEIWAAFVHCSTSVPKIGFMSEDLTTGQAREKAQQLRKFADEMDELAAQVDAFEQAGVRS